MVLLPIGTMSEYWSQKNYKYFVNNFTAETSFTSFICTRSVHLVGGKHYVLSNIQLILCTKRNCRNVPFFICTRIVQ